MKFFTSGVAAILILLSVNLQAQRLKLTEGDLSALKNEQAINVEFTYGNMKVGKFDSEAEYVTKKVEELNKKESGRGDSWSKNWVNDREARFEPKFNELFEKNSDMSVNSKKEAKYTLIFKTNFTEPGYNIGVWRKNAEINGEVWIVETSNKDKVIAKVSLQKALGRTFGGYDFDTGERIAEAYADAGKAVGRFVKEKS